MVYQKPNTACCREKEAIDRAHNRALEHVKAAAQEERSAWRAAVTEKIKRQALEREEQLRASLVKERDAEIDLVIQRLEAEQQAALQAAKERVSSTDMFYVDAAAIESVCLPRESA